MKLHQIGEIAVNLDAIEYVDMKERTLHFVSGNTIDLTEAELESFVSKYNRQNTNEVENAVKQLLKVARFDPNLLTREGLIEATIIAATRFGLKEEVKKMSRGKKLKELPTNILVKVYQRTLKRAEEIEKSLPF